MFNSISGYMAGPSNRMTGLVSGMDIDSLVDGLTMSTQSKITKKTQEKQILAWQTAAYRNISSKMIAFSSKYFSYGSSTNLLSSSFYQASTPKVNGSDFSDSITVSGSSSTASNTTITGISGVASTSNLNGAANAANTTISSTSDIGSLLDQDINSLAGKTIKITIPDVADPVEITFPKDFAVPAAGATAEDIGNAISTEINTQLGKAGHGDIKFSVGKLKDANGVETDKIGFHIKNGSGKKITMSGDALDVMRIKSGEVGVGNTNYSSEIQTSDYTTSLSLKDSKMTISLNGTKREITLKGNYANNAELHKDIQDQLDKEFGADKISVTLNGTKLEMKADGANDTLAVTKADKSISHIVGFEEGQYNRFNMEKNLDELSFGTGGPLTGGSISINGEIIAFDPAEDTMAELMQRVNDSDAGVRMSYSTLTNKFSIESKDTGSQEKIIIKDGDGGNLASLMGIATHNTDDTPVTDPVTGTSRKPTVTDGTDTTVTIKYNGEDLTLTSSTTSVSFDGLVIGVTQDAIDKIAELKKEAADEVPPKEYDVAITFSANADTSKVTETMAEFVKDFNEILDLVSGEYMTTKSGDERSYLPLTDEQKKDMTETQIADWEAIAKKGLLYGSTELGSLRNELRTAITSVLPSGDLASHIGLGTSKDYTANGKIEFNAEAFEKALNEDPAKIADMFTKGFDESLDKNSPEYLESGGIANRVKAITDKYASNIGEKGILIKKAGSDNSITSLDNLIAKQVEGIDKQIEALERTLSTQRSYHYDKFSALEVYLQQMESQSAWLYEQTM